MMGSSTIDRFDTRADLEKLVSTRYGGDYAAFVSDISRSVNALLLTDLTRARKLVESVKKKRRYFPSQMISRLDAIEARFLHHSGQSRKAARLYCSAIDSMTRGRQYASAARTRVGLMDVYMYLGKYDLALKTGKRALTYFDRRGETKQAARVLTNVGNIYHRLDKNRQAWKYYNRAREILAEDGGIPLAMIDFNSANVLVNLGKLDEAENLYTGAIRLFNESGAYIAAAKTRYSIAYLHFLRGNYSLALTTLEDVLRRFLSLGDMKSAAVTRLDLSELNIHLGQLGQAFALAATLIRDCNKLGMRYEAAKASYFAAEASLRLGDLSSSSSYLRKASSLFSQEKNSFWQGMVEILWSRLERCRGRHAEALRRGRSAKKMFARVGDARRRVDAEIELARTELQQDLTGSAFKRLGRLDNRKLTTSQQCERDVLKGTCREASGDLERALAHYEDAIQCIEQLLLNLYPDEIQYFFLLGHYDTYLKAVNCLVKLGRYRESFATNSRALSILNRRWPVELELKEYVPEKLIKTRDGLRAALRRLRHADDHGLRSGVPSRKTSRELENELWRNERRIRTHLYSSSQPPEYSLVQKVGHIHALGREDLLVNFVCLDGSVGAYVVSSREVRFVQCPMSEAEFTGKLRELHFLLENSVLTPAIEPRYSRDVHAYVRYLYDRLIDPLDIRGGKLLLLLEGNFCQVPFSGLINCHGRPFKNLFDYRVIMNPDCLWGRKRDLRISARSASAVFALSQDDLPLAVSEADHICRLFGNARPYLDSEATCEQLKHSLRTARGFVHIAAHAARSSENPLFSRILMNDGPLFPFDLSRTRVRPRLVVLSGCQTAAPGIYYGNSFSLAGAFHQAGADYVMAALWTVSDKITMVFMKAFYESLSDGNGIVTSYKCALDRTERINGNPAFWAPFVLLGI